MISNRINISGTVGGISMPGSLTVETDSAVTYSEPLALAKTGALTTRTSGTAGVITLTGGHGLGDGAHTVDIFWAADATTGLPGACYGAAATIATNACTIATVEGGDAFPAQTTSVTVAHHALQTFVLDGASTDLWAVSCPGACAVVFYASAAIVFGVVLPKANMWRGWIEGVSVEANPLVAESVDQISVTGASATVAKTIKVVAGYTAS